MEGWENDADNIKMDCATVTGIGVGMTRDCSTLMVAQYFKRRREFVEIFIVSGSGLGIAVMSAFIKGAIRYNCYSYSRITCIKFP
jgi:hypothetical protein